MSKGKNQKLKLMTLKDILYKKTDKEHSLTMGQLIDELEKRDISAERKSIYDDFKTFDDLKIPYKKVKKGKETFYSIEEREFELSELKLLVDAVQASKFITEKQSGEFIGKLEGLCSEHEKKQLQRQVYVSGRVKNKSDNNVFKAVDVIHNAINENRQIRFKYQQWNAKGELEYKNEGRLYKVSPWALTYDNSYYYLIAYDEAADRIKYYRVDKMSGVMGSDERRLGKECFKNFNLAEYMNKSNFNMFEGKRGGVVLKIKKELIGVFYDRFGKDSVSVISSDDNSSTIRFEVGLNEQFLGWIFALQDVEIVSPESAKKMAREMLERELNKY